MRRYKESVEDTVTFVVGATTFTVVAALTAAAMAVGFGTILAIERLRDRG